MSIPWSEQLEEPDSYDTELLVSTTEDRHNEEREEFQTTGEENSSDAEDRWFAMEQKTKVTEDTRVPGVEKSEEAGGSQVTGEERSEATESSQVTGEEKTEEDAESSQVTGEEKSEDAKISQVKGNSVEDGRRRWYRLGEVLSVEEDERHEFKGHRNVCPEDIPPWCRRAQDNSSRTRSAISRNLCGFLNRGVGGVVLVGVLDSGVVVGMRLSPSQQHHLILSLKDALSRFRPPVPHHLWSLHFIPVLGPNDGLPTHRLAGGDYVCDKEHTLRTHMYCWCDYEAIARFAHGLVPMNYVVEITIKPINKDDQWVKQLDPNSKVSFLPVFQADDAQIYMRKHSTLVRYSIRDVLEQAKEEVLIHKMDKLMEAWKKCRMSEKLLELWRKRVPEEDWKSIENNIKKERLQKGNKMSNVATVIHDNEGKIQDDENNLLEEEQKTNVITTEAFRVQKDVQIYNLNEKVFQKEDNAVGNKQETGVREEMVSFTVGISQNKSNGNAEDSATLENEILYSSSSGTDSSVVLEKDQKHSEKVLYNEEKQRNN